MYSQRHKGTEDHVAQAEPIQEAIELYKQALSENPDQLDLRWKLMRALYFRGRYTGLDEQAKQDAFSDLISVGETGLEQISRQYGINPEDKPEKYAEAIRKDENAVRLFFWQAAGWGQWALVYGKMKAVKKGVAGKIRRYAGLCRLVDPDMEDGGPARILGRLYHQTPRVPLITGWASNKEAKKFLTEAIERGPGDLMNHLFLAELLMDQKEPKEANEILIHITSTPPREEELIEDRDSIHAARLLLQESNNR